MESSSTKEILNFKGHLNLEENPPEILETFSNYFNKIQDSCIKNSIYFDIHYKLFYNEFLKQTYSQLQKKSNYSLKILSQLKILISRKNYFTKRIPKDVVKQFERVILPPKTKLYISLFKNIRREEINSIYQIIGPSSLEKPYSPKKLDLIKTNLLKLENQIPADKILKLSFIIKEIQFHFGMSRNYLKILAVLLGKNENILDCLWTKMLKDFQLKKIKKNKDDDKKIYAKKYVNYFCSICMVYGCIHFINVNNMHKNNQEKNETFCVLPVKIKWFLGFRCKSLSADCWRNLKKREIFNGGCLVFHYQKFRKYERKLIEFCRDYNMLNPCFIYLMLNNGNSNKTCSDIKIYVEQALYSGKFNNMELEKKNAFEISSNTKLIKRKKEKLPEYVPCFHEGFFFCAFYYYLIYIN